MSWPGMVSSLAAIVYVSHLGQAKADAGLGYELLAITAVVLGGTSIFGGRGTIAGTLLGLLAIAIFQNGLRLADLPAELAGVLTGTILLVAIGLDRRPTRILAPLPTLIDEGFTMKNGQVAALCLAILAAGLIVAGTNAYLIGTIRKEQPATSEPGRRRGRHLRTTPTRRPITVAMMPKSKGNAYFIACKKGAEEAAKELGIKLIWDGPTDPDPAKQNEVDRHLDHPGCRRDRRGRREPRRDLLRLAQGPFQRDQGRHLGRRRRPRRPRPLRQPGHARGDRRGPDGQRAAQDPRRQGGVRHHHGLADRLEHDRLAGADRDPPGKAKYPEIKMAALRPCDDLQKKAFDETNNLLSSDPAIKLIMAICTPAVPGAAEAIKQAGRKDVKVVGLGLPNDNKPYVRDGITDAVILWKTADLGYLAVLTARDLVAGSLKPGATSVEAGRLGPIRIEGDNVVLGKPFAFTKENIDQFDF